MVINHRTVVGRGPVPLKTMGGRSLTRVTVVGHLRRAKAVPVVPIPMVRARTRKPLVIFLPPGMGEKKPGTLDPTPEVDLLRIGIALVRELVLGGMILGPRTVDQSLRNVAVGPSPLTEVLQSPVRLQLTASPPSLSRQKRR